MHQTINLRHSSLAFMSRAINDCRLTIELSENALSLVILNHYLQVVNEVKGNKKRDVETLRVDQTLYMTICQYYTVEFDLYMDIQTLIIDHVTYS
jgi:hypothetical protein